MFRKLFSVCTFALVLNVFAVSVAQAGDPVISSIQEYGMAIDFDTLPSTITFKTWDDGTSTDLMYGTGLFGVPTGLFGIEDCGVVDFTTLNTFTNTGASPVNIAAIAGHTYTFKTTAGIPVKLYIQTISYPYVNFVAAYDYMSGGGKGFSGNISYFGSQPGNIYIVAGIGTPPGWTPKGQAMLAAPGPFSLNVSENGSGYYVWAYKDSNSNATYDNGVDPVVVAPAGPYMINDNIISGVSLELQDAGGSSGSISGNVNYSGIEGSGPGKAIAGLNEPYEGNPAWQPQRSAPITVPGSFNITNLPESSVYYVLVYRDSNNNDFNDYGEPFGYSGPYSVNGNVVSGVPVTVNDVGGGEGGGLQGYVGYSGVQTGTVYIKFKDGGVNGTDAGETSIFEYSNPSNSFFSMPLENSINYYVFAFMDVNDNSIYDAGEPQSIWDGPRSVTGSWTNINIMLTDGSGTGQGIEGLVNYSGIQFGGKVIVEIFDGDPQSGGTYANGINLFGFPDNRYYHIPLSVGSNFYIRAYLDTNYNDTLDDGEPFSTWEGPRSTSSNMFTIMDLNMTDSGEPAGDENKGTNYIMGDVSFTGSSLTRLISRCGIGDQYGIYPNQQLGYIQGYGWLYFNFGNLSDGNNFYVEVFADTNNNNICDTGIEPRIYQGPLTLNADTMPMQYLPITLESTISDTDMSAGTITVTIRGKLVDENENPIGGATVFLMDPGGFNNYDWNTFITKSSVTSNGALSGTSPNDYNFEFTAQNVKISQGMMYNYQFKAVKSGYKQAWMGQSFMNFDAGSTKYLWMSIQPRPVVTVSDLVISPTTISPNFDGKDDRAQISFKYSVATNMSSPENGASIKFVIDADDDGLYEVMDNSLFFYSGDGKRFKKKNSTDFINWSNPDYSKLIGPISEDSYQQLVAEYDPTIEFMCDGWGLAFNGTDSYYQDVYMMWEGRDNSWNPLPGGTYTAKLMIDDQMFDASDGLTYSTTVQITIESQEIYGTVTDSDGDPVSGAKVDVYGPTGGNMAFTKADGTFHVSGVRPGRYGMNVTKDGYVAVSLNDVLVEESGDTDAGTIELGQGITVTGVVTLPNPPLAGALKDNMGYSMQNLWANVEVWRSDGPGWYRSDFMIPLSKVALSSVTATYSISLEPGEFSMKVRSPGYASKEEQISIVDGQSAPTKDFTLERTAEIRGMIKLPVFESTTTASEFFDQTGRYWLWINLGAESADRKNRTGCGVGFSRDDVILNGKTTAEFTLFDLLPNKKYTLFVESEGTFARQQKVFYSSAASLGTIDLSFGGILTGTITLKDDCVSQLDANDYGPFQGEGNIPDGIPININVRSFDDNSWNGTMVYITTVAFPSSAQYTIRGLSSGKYEINVNAGSVDVAPDIQNRIVTLSTSVAMTKTVPFDIEMSKPTGSMQGTITNNSGNAIDWNKVCVTIAYPSTNGQDHSATPIQSASNPNVANYSVSDLPTGEAVIWVSEFDVAPSSISTFGKASGNTGTSWVIQNTRSGGTTSLNLELKAASTIYVKIYGSVSAISDIVAKTTTYAEINAIGGMGTGIARIQSIFMRKFAERTIAKRKEMYGGKEQIESSTIKDMMDLQTRIPNMKETSQIALFTGAGTDDGGSYAKFEIKGLEEGIYYVYPLVNTNFYIEPEYGMGGMGGDNMPQIVKYPYACIPFESFEVLNARETKEVVFTLSAGVNLSGTVKRAQAGVSENITVSLKNPFSGENIATTQVDFSSQNAIGLTTKSFAFNKVSPGKFIVTVWSPNYKIYSKEYQFSASSENVSLGQISLEKGASIIGSLVDANNKAISQNVLVECWAYPFVEGSYKNTDMAGVTLSSETSTAGRFTLPNLPGGTYMIKISPKSGSTVNYMVTTKAGITVPNSQAEVDAGTIKLNNGTAVSGKVTVPGASNTKIPVSNVLVIAYPQSVQDREGKNITATTDQNGLFTLRGLDLNVKYWEIKANARKDDPTQWTEVMKKYGPSIKSNILISTNTPTQSFNLLPSNAELKGNVKIPAAYSSYKLLLPFPVPGIEVENFPAALVLLQSPADLASGDPMSGLKAITNPDGSFNIKGLVAGTYTLKVFAKAGTEMGKSGQTIVGFATFAKQVTILANTVNDAGNLELTSGASLSGTIRTQIGGKISSSDASMVVAATKDFKKFVFGSLSINPVTLEVNSYEIIGLEPAVDYYVVLLAPETGKVFVDPTLTNVATNAENKTKNITYNVYPPNFEAKVTKFTYKKEFIESFKNLISLFPSLAGTLTLPIPLGDDDEALLVADLPSVDLDLYYIYGYATEPLQQESMTQVITTVTAQGTIKYLSTFEEKFQQNRKDFLVVYVPSENELLGGASTFIFNFHGTNSKDLIRDTQYEFWFGEDARSVKIINPMAGGTVELGEDDPSGILVPPGSIEDAVALSSGTRVTCMKVTDESIGAQKRGKYAKGAFSFPIKAFDAAKPGTQVSSLYEMRVNLISGPLASISQNTPISVNLQLSDNALDYDEEDLKLYNLSSDGTSWEEVTGIPTIDWGKFTLSMNVTHCSKFAVFAVASSDDDGGGVDVASTTVTYDVTTSTSIQLTGGGNTADIIIDPDTFEASGNVSVVVTLKSGLICTTDGLTGLGKGIEITATSAGNTLQPKKPIKLSYVYTAADATGVTNEKTIGMAREDAVNSKWVLITNSKVDTTLRKVEASLTHLTLFQLVARANANLNSVQVFPNPYKPGSATIYDRALGIRIDNLTTDAKVKIFNIAGELVYDVTATDGYIDWLAVNKSGNELASGVYIYYITDTDGHKAKGKFAVMK